MRPIIGCAYDYRELARRRIPRIFFDYLDGGAFNEQTIAENKNAYSQITLHKTVLHDVTTSDTSTEVLGQQIPQPLIMAPIGFTGLYARRGEIQVAKAAEKAGVPFCLSTLSICSIAQVRQAVTKPFWFQLYMLNDKKNCLELLKEAQAAGCSVLVFTVDLPILGIRYRDIRNGMFRDSEKKVPFASKLTEYWQYISHVDWFYDVFLRGQPLQLGNLVPFNINFHDASHYRAKLSWDDLAWVRQNWSGKLLVKGILDSRDALKAAEMGADGIIISNHAGRHLDSLPATVSVLPRIAEALNDRITIIVDGGIFNGLDVLKALALGAHACMIGRAWGYALAARGEQGVSHVLAMLQTELANAMSQLGVANIRDIHRELILTTAS